MRPWGGVGRHLGLPESKIYFCCEKGPSLSLPNTQMSCCFPRNGLWLTKAREGVSTEAGSMRLQSSLSSADGYVLEPPERPLTHQLAHL